MGTVLDELGVDAAELLLAGVVVSVRAYLQGSVSFGLALVAVALLADRHPAGTAEAAFG